MRDPIRRYAAQQPIPGEEAALRRMVNELAAGKPDYDRMTPKVASEVKLVAELDRQIFSALGPVVSTAFKHMSAGGVEPYRLVFQHGEGDLEISLDENGKVQHALYFQE